MLLAQDIRCRIAQQQADQRGDNGYSDGADKRVHRFGVHHELAEVGQRKLGGMVDAHVSGACVERHAGSSPVLGTMLEVCGNSSVGRA